MQIIEKEKEKIKSKAREKYSRVFSMPQALVPDSSVVEQASSQPTAEYAASLAQEGAVVADLTAGLGVNSFAFSETAEKVFAVEIDRTRAEALAHNSKLLDRKVEVVNCDGVEWFRNNIECLDVIFVDPARRNADSRFFRIEDSSPDIDNIIGIIKNHSAAKEIKLIIKVSPLVDVTSVINRFREIKAVHIIESRNEVKELLLEMNFRPSGDVLKEREDVKIVCVRIFNDGRRVIDEYTHKEKVLNDRLAYCSSYEEISNGNFLYIPSPAAMKAAMFGTLIQRFPALKKMAPNTHLFTSAILYPDFPGKILKIKGFLGSGELKRMKGGRYNVISRNHPAKASELESQYKFKSSEKDYLIACTIGKSKAMMTAMEVS